MRILMALACLALATPAVAQEDRPIRETARGQDSDSSEIIVRGTREEVRGELREMIKPSGGQLARLEQPFCVQVYGFDAEYTPILERLIRANAARSGIPVDQDENCHANSIVIFSDEPQRLVKGMRQRMPIAFDRIPVGTRSRMSARDRGSYAWHTTYVKGADGRPAGSTPAQLDTGGGLDTFLAGIPVVDVMGSSRLQTASAYYFTGAYLVLDLARTPGMTLGQIADYAALNLLVDLNIEAVERAHGDSILSLFDSEDPTRAPAGMSVFDRAMIDALYGVDDLAKPANRMRGLLAREIKRAQEEGPNPAE